ncbi:ATP-binding protein [Anabaena azotica]|uniref:sensor histidine kinase n=1 Tax=Anabaena azotica TaxID=197653 RepID=UPI0039A72590
MKLYFSCKWIVAGFFLIILLMGLVAFASFNNTSEIKGNANKVHDNYQTLNILTDFYAKMTVAESARRGYIFLGSRQDLYRYQAAINNMKNNIILLDIHVHNSVKQKQRLAILKSLVHQRVELLEESIKLYQQDKSALLRQNQITEHSVNIREQIIPIIAEIQAEEKSYLISSLELSEQSIHLRLIIEILATMLSMVVICSLYFIIDRQWVKHEHIKSLEASLVQEKKIGELKVQLFSMISHEFRTPLSVILLSCQLLREILIELVDEKELKNLYRIQSSAKLMNHLLTDILTLTRAEAGELDYKPQLINVENFCLNLLEDVQMFSRTTHIIKFIKHGQSFRANLDEKLLYSILTNLLLNAIKYSSPGGKIYLVLNAQPEATIFQVIDEGIGISPAEQQRLYEPYYRSENVEGIVGTGLGLPIVKKCVDRHQGEISVDSKVGVGTTFTVKIPT